MNRREKEQQRPQPENLKLEKKERRGILLRLFKYVFSHPYLFILAIILSLVSNQLALLGPEFSGIAVDAIAAEGGVDFATVRLNVIKMIFCYLLSAVLGYLLSVVMVFLGQKIVYTMRRQVFEKLNTLPVSYFDTHPTGDIVSRISYDIDTVNSTLSHDLVQIMTSVYTVLGSLIFMWRISKPMLLVFAVTVPISIMFTRYRAKKVRPLFRARSRSLGELNGYAEEMLSGCRTISAYGREGVICDRFSKRNAETMEQYYKAEYYGTTIGPGVNFINNLSISLVAILGGILYMYSKSGAVLSGTMFFITLGGVTKFVMYSRKFAGPINEFANIIHEFQSAISAAERIFRVLDEQPEPLDRDDALSLGEVFGRVEFSDVTFGYTKKKTILKGISIKTEPGKTFAIVGPTGAGKTTIINLLMRFYDADTGEIRVDGVPIKDIKRRDLRLAYTMVLQDSWLFSGTVYDNIVYGKENATEAEVKEAARMARIDSFIERLPNGYYTEIGDDGINISKGQRQLITIARAFLSDAPMLILDEATSNVDSRTEIKIQEAMNRLISGRTSFVIAHRLSTIQNADTILVIRDGRIDEAGSHDELMAKGGFYSTLYNSQFA
ncbi:MAG: ABC transporter ATP-binding protein [Clostridia bacterium]|nr:ABC transporter ATP-binding protein [Clostridia bacterium]